MKRNKAESYQMELLFRALADRTRLRLLNLMGDDEVCVCFLVEALKLTQPKISRHLAYFVAGMLSAVREWLVNDPAMQSDRGRLLRLCCSPTLPAALRKAPKPTNIATAH